MLLDVNGMQYTAHFNHRTEDFWRGNPGGQFNVGKRWITKCIFHSGKCAIPNCADHPNKSFASIGRAVCNPVDQFSKSKGRIKSLTKALAEYVPTKGAEEGKRQLRAQIWDAYFKIVHHK